MGLVDTLAMSTSVSHFPATPAPAMTSESAERSAGKAAAAIAKRNDLHEHNFFIEHLRGMKSAQGGAALVRVRRTRSLHAQPVPSISGGNDPGPSRSIAPRGAGGASAVIQRRTGLRQNHLITIVDFGQPPEQTGVR